MNYEPLGIDQQKPAEGITGIFIDTDADKAIKAIDASLWDNPEYTDITSMATPKTFINDLVKVLKSKSMMLTPDTFQTVQLALLHGYPERYTRVDYLDTYLNNFMILTRDGKIPASIYDPISYAAPEDFDLGAVLGAGAKNTAWTLGTVVVLGVAAYAFFSAGLPAMTRRA